jgi:hypothetical protein
MNTPRDPIVRKLIAAISLARGELVIGTAELQEAIGLTGEARHSRTLVGTLNDARDYLATRGLELQWRFVRSEIVVRYRFSQVTRADVATGARRASRIMLVR